MRVDAEIKDVLERCKVEGGRLELPEQLERPLYLKVAKVLELLGGKWNRKAGAHLFEEDAEAVVLDAIATGEVLDPKQVFGFFETPEGLADRLVEMAEVMPYHSCFEPSAGRGRIASRLKAKSTTTTCEIQPKNQEALRELGVSVLYECDFMKLPEEMEFDRIVANPPFARGQDMTHVMKMWRHLRPGGVLVSVMSPGWTFGSARQATEFREFVEAVIGQWNPLPEGSFKESGTMVNTGILKIWHDPGGARTRWHKPLPVKAAEPAPVESEPFAVAFTATINRKTLRAALTALGRVARFNSTIPSCTCVAIHARDGSLSLVANDLDRTLTIDQEYVELEGDGGIAVQWRSLDKVIGSLTGEALTLAQTGETELTIGDGKASVKLPGMTLADVPVFPSFTERARLRFRVADLAPAIRKVLVAVSTEESRFQLNGAFLDLQDKQAYLVSTDGHRLIAKEVAVERLTKKPASTLVPLPVLCDILALSLGESVEMVLGTIGHNEEMKPYGRLEWAGGSLSWFGLEGTFADWRRVIGSRGSRCFPVNTAEVKSFCALAGKLGVISAKMTFNGNLELSGKHVDNGEVRQALAADESWDSPAEPISLGMNPTYLSDAVALCGDTANLWFSDATSVVHIEDPKQTDLRHIVMPMKP